jgi:hypothetical protein
MSRYLIALLFSVPALAGSFDRIVVSESSHPAVQSAARILARNLGLPETAVRSGADTAAAAGEIILTTAPNPATKSIRHDGYAIVFARGGAVVYGVRPRSLLYAAADAHLWRGRSSGTFVRDPSFAIRSTTTNRGQRTLAEHVAAMGVNVLTGGMTAAVSLKESLPEVYNLLSPGDQRRLDQREAASAEQNARFMRECHDADVTCYADLPYGNNFSRWDAALYAAALKAFPTAKGTDATTSWEKAALCPSDPGTWKLVDAYVKEYAEKTGADGLEATFWDQFGMYCQCDRCKRNGLNRFPNELYVILQHYNNVLSAMGKKLSVRTWSSGTAHWLNGEWVHAPGNGGFSGTGLDLWGRVIRELPAGILLQTKVYESDCEPDARFNTLLGQARPHTQLVEYQITGQTTGRFYFPASIVDHTAATMRKAYALLGPEGGTQAGPGGTHQSNYNLFDDILNSINVYAWRELSWNVNADVNTIWNDWATPIYGQEAAPHMIAALKLSEEATYRTFSPVGFGSSTNSDFAGNIARRETLLKYTNRFYLPEYAAYLEPTRENIARVAKEKAACRANIATMLQELDLARPHLTPDQAAELSTRFDWLKEFSLVNTTLDEALWRFRYLRRLAAMLTTDPAELEQIAQAYDVVKEHQKLLFRYDPAQKFTCYDRALGKLQTKPDLGNPLPLMKEMYDQSKAFVEQSVGPLEPQP